MIGAAAINAPPPMTWKNFSLGNRPKKQRIPVTITAKVKTPKDTDITKPVIPSKRPVDFSSSSSRSAKAGDAKR